MADTLLVNLPGAFELAVTDSFGCIYFDEIMIELGPDCDSILIPNVFTPNGDGFNDRFQAKADYISDFQMLIFDRWGNHLFEANDWPINSDRHGWDGTCRGQAMDPGVYAYSISFRLVNGEYRTIGGDVLLLR